MIGGLLLAVLFAIRVNHAGYEPNSAKFCAVENPPAEEFVIQTIGTNVTWRNVYKGKFVPSKAGKGLMIGDFSSLKTPGDYRILCGDVRENRGGCDEYGLPKKFKGVASFHFPIREGVYDNAERLFIQYCTWQRCGHDLGWAGRCHQDPVPVKDAEGRIVRTIDARGGYHQSCDLRNWHDGIPMSVYRILRYAELCKPRWDRGDIADEIRWGCDYFLKVIAPEGYVYDAQFAPCGWGPRDYYLAPATLGAQCNVAMLLARASKFFENDAAYAARLLAAAKGIYRQVEENAFFAKLQPAPAKNLPAGAQPAERCYFQQYRSSANGISERCGAALELYRATGEAAYAEAAKARGCELLALQRTEGKDAGLYRLEPGSDQPAFKDWSYCWGLAGVRMPLELFREFGREEYRVAALRTAEAYVREMEADDFKPGRQAAPSVAAARAEFLSSCAALFGRRDFLPFAQLSLDWVFGANPDNSSYIEGVGQNQFPRPVFGQFFPSTPQIPGGVLHKRMGEYDMPPTTAVLWALAELRAARK